MSKDFDSINTVNEITETSTAEVIAIDELSLALIGGGEYTVAY